MYFKFCIFQQLQQTCLFEPQHCSLTFDVALFPVNVQNKLVECGLQKILWVLAENFIVLWAQTIAHNWCKSWHIIVPECNPFYLPHSVASAQKRIFFWYKQELSDQLSEQILEFASWCWGIEFLYLHFRGWGAT